MSRATARQFGNFSQGGAGSGPPDPPRAVVARDPDPGPVGARSCYPKPGMRRTGNAEAAGAGGAADAARRPNRSDVPFEIRVELRLRQGPAAQKSLAHFAGMVAQEILLFHRFYAFGVPCAAGIRAVSNRSKASAYLAYAVGAVILGVFLLCILSWPFSWLVQYVVSMGLTPRRVCGLLYTVAGGLLVVGFIALAFEEADRDCRRPIT